MSIEQETKVRGLLKLPESFLAELEARSATLDAIEGISLVIGLGPGGIQAVEQRMGIAQNHVIAIDASPTPSGKLDLVAPHKGLHQAGLDTAMRALTKPNATTFLNAPVDFSGNDPSKPSLAELVRLSNAQEVLLATGTTERRTILVDGTDIGNYKGHAYAYELIEKMNKWMTNGKNLGEFPLDFNHDGNEVFISGAGLVSLEDMSKLILAYQIINKMNSQGVDITALGDPNLQLKFSGQPLTTLKAMYADSSDSGAKIRQWLGADLNLGGQDYQSVLLNRLHELGIKRTYVLYRKDDANHLNLTGEKTSAKKKLTRDQLNALSRLDGFEMLYSNELGFVTTVSDKIQTMTLVTGDYEGNDRVGITVGKTYKPALIISALGGESPNLDMGSFMLEPKKPRQVDGVVYAIAGSAVDGSGNRAASIGSTSSTIAEIDKNYKLIRRADKHALEQTLAYLSSFNQAPTNVVLEILKNTPELLLQKWGWA